MTPIFADTSFFIALLSPRDQNHVAALHVSSKQRPQIVVTDFVLVEVANAFSGIDTRRRVISFWDQVRKEPATDIVVASPELIERGFDLYARRPDKEWSLTDCISFVVMEDRNLTDALTADRHFEQAGFNALLLA